MQDMLENHLTMIDDFSMKDSPFFDPLNTNIEKRTLIRGTKLNFTSPL